MEYPFMPDDLTDDLASPQHVAAPAAAPDPASRRPTTGGGKGPPTGERIASLEAHVVNIEKRVDDGFDDMANRFESLERFVRYVVLGLMGIIVLALVSVVVLAGKVLTIDANAKGFTIDGGRTHESAPSLGTAITPSDVAPTP